MWRPGRGWVGAGGRAGGGAGPACHVLRRGETLSEGTLSALMEWLAGPPGGSPRSPHLEPLRPGPAGAGRER